MSLVFHAFVAYVFAYGPLLLIGSGVGYWMREASEKRKAKLAARSGLARIPERASAPAPVEASSSSDVIWP